MNMEQILTENIEKDDKAIDNVINMIDYKRGGKQPPFDNWLWKLNVNAVFLTRPRTGSIVLTEYHLIFKSEKHVLLLNNINKEEVYGWVDPILFSGSMELAEIIKE